MKSRELSTKVLSIWIATAMAGPAALVCASSAWSSVVVVAILCSVLCGLAYRSWGSHICKSKLLGFPFIIWNVYALAVVASMGSQCWPGKGSQIAIASVLLLLGILSANKGAHSAGAVAAILGPLCAAIFAIVLACGIGNINWNRMEFAPLPPDGMLIFTFLLPTVAVAIPRREGVPVKSLALSGLLSVILSGTVMGTMSLYGMLTKENPFLEFSKGLNLFGVVQRFESISAVAVTFSLYAMISLLLSGTQHVTERLFPGSGKWAVLLSAGLGLGIIILGLWLSTEVIAILSIMVWGLMGVVGGILEEKKQENRGFCP